MPQPSQSQQPSFQVPQQPQLSDTDALFLPQQSTEDVKQLCTSESDFTDLCGWETDSDYMLLLIQHLVQTVATVVIKLCQEHRSLLPLLHHFQLPQSCKLWNKLCSITLAQTLQV